MADTLPATREPSTPASFPPAPAACQPLRQVGDIRQPATGGYRHLERGCAHREREASPLAGALGSESAKATSQKGGFGASSREMEQTRTGGRSSVVSTRPRPAPSQVPPSSGPRHARRAAPSLWSRHRQRVEAKKARRRGRRYWPGRHPKTAGLVIVILALSPVWVSLSEALTNPSLGLSLPARGAEWVRDHGGGSLVASIENWWYSHHPPPVGGKPSAAALPRSHGSRTSSSGGQHSGVTPLPKPAALVPFAHPALKGEGQWTPAGRPVDGMPAIYTTFMRPDAIHTSIVDGVAWMDTRLLSATLYSGSYIPGGGPYKYTAPIKPQAARTLVAAFNAGFTMQDANGGYFTQGKTIIPLRKDAASFVIYKGGSVAIGAWGSQVKMTPKVVAVRQNLRLLVNNGRPVPGLNANDTSVWGLTLGNAVYVSRSGIGITKNGALVYVGGPGLNITDLAHLLVRAGAVRAMELDINTDWVNYATFDPKSPHGLASPANGTDLLPLADMAGPANRYFVSWWARDFFTMSARNIRR